MNNGGQPNSNDFRAMAPLVTPLNGQEYASRKAKIEEARRKLVEMERENELEEAVRKGREAEQRLAELRASTGAGAPIAAGSSSGNVSGYYPNSLYQSVEEVPLTARIEGEVRDSPPDSSRPSTQVPYHNRPNHPTTSQPPQAGFQAHAPQFSSQPPLQRSSFVPTQSQAAATSRSSHAPYPRGSVFAVPGYQHTITPYQGMYQNSQPYQQQQFKYSEEYWAKLSQKYAAELAGAGAPQTQTASVGVNPQASSFAGTGIPQHAAHVQRQMTSSAAPSQAVATAVPSTLRPALSSTESHSTNRQSSGNLTITKPEFIRQFQLACNRNAQAIRDLLSSCPVAVDWWAEAARSVDPANFKDEGVVTMLNELRNSKWSPLPRTNSSTSASTSIHVPMAIVPSETSAVTVQPLPPPANSPSAQQRPAGLGTKEAFVRYFHERFQRVDMDTTVDFLMKNLHSVPEEWRKLLISSLAPELLMEFGRAVNHARASAASKAHLDASSAATLGASSDRVPNIAQQSQTTVAGKVVAPVTTHTTPKSFPVPPRPSVTKSTQATSISAQPPKASTSNRTAATTVAALAAKTTSAPQAQVSVSTTQTAPSVPSIQPASSTTTQTQPLAGTSINGQVAGGAYRPFNVPPPMSIPSASGKVAHYAYDRYLNQYVRTDIPNEPTVPSGLNAGGYYPALKPHIGQQPPSSMPQGIPLSMQATATVSIPPATPPPRERSGTALEARTPQQADKSRLAKDILRSLGLNPPPITAEEEDEADEEVGVSLGNLPVAAEHQRETSPSRGLSAEPLQEAPQEISLLQPPSNVLMEQGERPQIQTQQSHINEAIDDVIMMDDQTSATAPANGTASPKSPLPASTPCPASTSMDQEELARGVDGISIATHVHRHDPSQEDEHIDSPISFPDLEEPLPPVPEPAGISSPAPSFRAQSHEQSEDNRNGAIPLFLPSPSASPVPSDHSGVPLPPETDDEVLIVDSILRGGSPSKSRADSGVYALDEERGMTPLRSVRRKKGQRVYVLVPLPPPELRRAIKKRKLEDHGIVSGSEEEEESKYNDFERALIADCRVRMVERPCQWNGCDALMNSGENLYLHLKSHAQEINSQGPYTCRWQSCPRRFKSAPALEKHLQKHSYFPLPCPLANCSDVFDKPVEAMEHEVRHQQRESIKKLEMKQPPKPHVPKIPPRLDPPPNSLPSYRVEPRYIRQAHIPPQRHAVIGPWVLQHIFSPVEQNLRKQNAPMRLRYPRPDARPENLDNLRARPDEYDFLASLSTSPARTIRFDDLDSGGVSLALLDGLMLWDTDSNRHADKSNPEGEGFDPTKDTVINAPEGSASSSVAVEVSGNLPMGEAPTNTMDGMNGSHWTTEGAVGEEEAVVMMLRD